MKKLLCLPLLMIFLVACEKTDKKSRGEKLRETHAKLMKCLNQPADGNVQLERQIKDCTADDLKIINNYEKCLLDQCEKGVKDAETVDKNCGNLDANTKKLSEKCEKTFMPDIVPPQNPGSGSGSQDLPPILPPSP